MSEYDPVDKPKHYNVHPSGVECIQITEHMGFCLGNVIKYVWRADIKGDAVEDLKKAKWYIERELAKREHKCYGGDGGLCACFADEERECDDEWVQTIDKKPPMDGTWFFGDWVNVHSSCLYGRKIMAKGCGHYFTTIVGINTTSNPERWKPAKQPLTDSNESCTENGRE